MLSHGPNLPGVVRSLLALQFRRSRFAMPDDRTSGLDMNGRIGGVQAPVLMKRVVPVACAMLAVSTLLSGQGVSLEYQVKAAYLFNFTKYVNWPAAALRDGEPLAICVAGSNPFGSVLSATVTGETVAGRSLTSRVVRGTASPCHVLFVPRNVSAAPYLRRVGTAPVLTVGEASDFLAMGGMIAFVIDRANVRFEINQAVATRADLTISSRLLSLAVPQRGATP